MCSQQPNSTSTPRRPVVLGLLGATTVGLPGATRITSAAATRPRVSIEFAGPKVAKINPASALTSLTVYYRDKHGERATMTDIPPTRPGRWWPIQLRYAKGNDIAIVQAFGGETKLVRVVGHGTECERGATNPNLGDDVPRGFNCPPTANFNVSPSTPEVGEEVTFSSTASDPDLPNDRLEYEWDLDGDNSYETRGREVTHTYNSTDEVTVYHRVTDDFGVADTARRTVSPQTPDRYEQFAKLTAADAAAGDSFGRSVSVSGNTAVVGADEAAYVFVRSGGTWTQQAKLTAADAATRKSFGVSVSVSEDTTVIGAQGDATAGEYAGAAYVFVRASDTWIQQAKLIADDAAAYDRLGYETAVSGETAVIRADRTAYVFVRSGGTWTQQAKLTADDVSAGDSFGNSVGVSGDTAIVGAHLDEEAGQNSGAAYVFVRAGDTWTHQAKLTAADAVADNVFGSSVAVSGDTAVVGAYLDDDEGFASGSAYMFNRAGGTWNQVTKLTADDAAADDLFGYSVAVFGDTAVVGARGDDEADSWSGPGSAYVFNRAGETWTQRAKLTAADAAAKDIFGNSVAVSEDVVVVGARRNDDAGCDSGSAYVFGE